MKKLASVAVLVLLPCLMFAEDKNAVASRPPNVVTRMIRLQHANPRQVRDLLVGTGAQAYWDDALRVVVVSGTPSEVASLEQTVKDLDSETAKIGVSNADLTVYVLGASQDNVGTGKIPASLQRTADQIKAAFPYQSLHLLETAVARCRVGEETQVSGSLEPFREDDSTGIAAPNYRLRLRLNGSDTVGTREVFHVQGFSFYAGFPYVVGPQNARQTQRSDASIQTNFDISSGQQVVIGKAGIAGNSAIFVIVEAKAVK